MKRFTILACLVVLLVLVPSVPAFGPAISQVSPSSGPNNGVVTITVTGTCFNSLSVVRLNKCRLKTGGSSQAVFEGRIIHKTDTSVTATFDLTNKLAGDYDVSLNAPFDGHEAWAVASGGFTVYQASGPAPPVTATTPSATTTVTTATTVPQGTNSVFFETSPAGATIYLDGEEVGISPFTYYTNHKGTFNVVVWKSGYDDYEATVNILEGKLIHFVAPLTPRSSSVTTTATTVSPAPTVTSTTTPKTTATTATTATTRITTAIIPGTTTITPGTTATTIGNFSIAIPTSWPTDTPVTEKSPVDPALAPGAALLGIVLVLIRRR